MNLKKSLLISLMLCMVFLVGGLPSVSAEDKNDTIEIAYGQNYENKETGEYFRWFDSITPKGTVAKNFEFKITHSVKSSGFTINSTKVSVVSSAHVEDVFGNYVSGYTGHKYSVTLEKFLSSKNLQFALGQTESGTLSGLSNGDTYTVTITNNDRLSAGDYLVGSGTITNN